MIHRIRVSHLHVKASDVKPIKPTKPSKPRSKPQIVAPQPLEKKITFDRELTEFEVRVAISATAMLFSMGMLVTKRGDPGMYLPLITSIIGYWTPSPTKKD